MKPGVLLEFCWNRRRICNGPRRAAFSKPTPFALSSPSLSRASPPPPLLGSGPEGADNLCFSVSPSSGLPAGPLHGPPDPLAGLPDPLAGLPDPLTASQTLWLPPDPLAGLTDTGWPPRPSGCLQTLWLAYQTLVGLPDPLAGHPELLAGLQNMAKEWQRVPHTDEAVTAGTVDRSTSITLENLWCTGNR